MEKRDTLEGETVKREKAGLGSGVLGTERGGGESHSSEDVARGCSGKSSSHSYPAPEKSQKTQTEPGLEQWNNQTFSTALQTGPHCPLGPLCISQHLFGLFTGHPGPPAETQTASSETKKLHFGQVK